MSVPEKSPCFLTLGQVERNAVMRERFIDASRDKVTVNSDPALETPLCDREGSELSIGRIVSASGNVQFSLYLPEMPITDGEAITALGLSPDCVGTPPTPAQEQQG